MQEGANASGTWGEEGPQCGCSAGMSCFAHPLPAALLLWVRRRLTLRQEPPEAFMQTQALWDCHWAAMERVAHLAIHSFIHSWMF